MALDVDYVKACYYDLLLMEHITEALQKDISKVVDRQLCIKPLPNKT